MASFTLHCFAQSGNAYKPALALELAGADWTPHFVDFFHGATRAGQFRELNVMGEVPVLEHAGRKFAQSGVILDYLVDVLGCFGPKDGDERREILRWILWDNHKLTSYTATYRYLRTFVADPSQEVMAEFGKRAEAAWKVLDAHLAGRDFVVGERLTIADLSLCGYLFFDDEIGVDWIAYPNIDRWLGTLKATPRWRHPYQLMPGHPRNP
ncbi:MAG TPA: glutathione S-transferase [Casimicrobiaceae bacterium]|jgi:glutathione S-transferase